MAQPPKNEAIETSDFSVEQAFGAAQIAALPNIYERSMRAEGDREIALSAVSDAAPDGVSQVNVIDIGNTTVIMALNPDQGRAYIAFDPTHTLGDRWDNFRRGHREHDLGGEVHGGLYDDIVEDQTTNENFPGESMTDVMGMVLHDYASKSPDQTLSVDFVGFSSGGMQTSMAAGQMMAEGFFNDYPNIRLGNIYTLGSPAYADETFIQALETEAENLGASIYEVQIHGDQMSNVLSPDGGSRFSRYDYDHAGEHIYIVPASEGQNLQVLVNPSDEEIAALPEPAGTSKELHTIDSYKNILENRPPATNETVISPDTAPGFGAGNSR